MLHPSFWRYSRLLDPAARRRPSRVMLQNYVTGCASIGNAALRRPNGAHDFLVIGPVEIVNSSSLDGLDG